MFTSALQKSSTIISRSSWVGTSSIKRMHTKTVVNSNCQTMFLNSMAQNESFRNDIANKLAYSSDEDALSRSLTPKLSKLMAEQLEISKNQLRRHVEAPVKSDAASQTTGTNEDRPRLSFNQLMAERQLTLKNSKKQFLR
jgi:hypothetical protein